MTKTSLTNLSLFLELHLVRILNSLLFFEDHLQGVIYRPWEHPSPTSINANNTASEEKKTRIQLELKIEPQKKTVRTTISSLY